MSQNTKHRLRHSLSSLCHRHHFSNPSTTDIVISLLVITLISKALSLLGKDA